MDARGLHWPDYLIIAAYAISILALGWYCKRRQKTADEYFVGNRRMSPFLIGISLFATLFSTVTYLSVPGEIIRHGPAFLSAMLSMPIVYFILGYWLIPAFMQYRVTSAYELLETRLGLSARLTGAVMFIALRMLWMSVLLNLAAKAMLVIFGADNSWLLAMTAAIGFGALIYSTFGGLRAVVITDLVQFMLLFGGAVLIVVAVTVKLGGFSWFPTSWDDDWARQPLFSFDPFVRMTVVGAIVMQTVWAVCTFGSDQTSIQRFMATADAAAARRSFLVKTVAGIVVLPVLGMVGFSLLGYFREFPAK